MTNGRFRLPQQRLQDWIGTNAPDNAELASITEELRRFLPHQLPVLPQFFDETVNPITRNSRLEKRLLVEYFAKCFQQEAAIFFGRPNIKLQFDPFSIRDYEAWLFLRNDLTLRASLSSAERVEEVASREQINRLLEADGCCLFHRDATLTDEQQRISPWVVAWVWTFPDHRNRGAMRAVMPAFERYGDFWIEGPVSQEIQTILTRREIPNTRVLTRGQAE